MKKWITVLLLLTGLHMQAQFNNEWIDYSKTYFKLKVAANGLYRIPQSVLQGAGLEAIPVEQFQLWRNGEQVPMFTSPAFGPMGPGGFLEFYGMMNDGKADTRLYRNPSDQLNDRWSLETDTAVYFLTVNPTSFNFRFANLGNNVAGNSLPAEPWFLHTQRVDYRTKLNPGFAAVVGELVYSSSYDIGEGWTSRDVTRNTALVEQMGRLYPAAGGPDPTLQIAASGNALNARFVRVFVNGTQVLNQAMNFFTGGTFNAPVPASLIGTTNDTIRINNGAPNDVDRMVVSKVSITYPRQFNFGGASNFEFSLPTTPVGNYVEISNFNGGGQPPVLLDLTNNLRYIGDITVPGLVRFALPAGNERDFVLLSVDPSAVRNIGSLQVRNFINYAQPSLQSNYIIISNPLLYSGPGGNPVEKYRAFRNSALGGGYDAKIYDVDQLIDQFGYGIKGHPLSVKNFLSYARSAFVQQPKFVFIIGKGINYEQQRNFESRALLSNVGLVPTFGWPGSDNILASNGYSPSHETPIGRLSAVNGQEVEAYLEKVKEHENVITSGTQTLKDRGWMKNVVHAIGGSDPYLQAVIFGYMNANGQILADTLFGGNIKSFSKNSAFAVQQLTSTELKSLFSEGINILTYFGHSSANVLEFNLDDPSQYDNQGKYPLFIVNGCNAGNIFLFDTVRLNSNQQTLSEKYVLANQRGSIAFMASTHYGIVNYLNIFSNSMYGAISGDGYGKSIGEVHNMAIERMIAITGTSDYYARLHSEQITLHGDPALKLYPHNQPDYVVEAPQVRISPAFVSVADASFEIEAKLFNIGRAVNDSIVLLVQRQLPSGAITDLVRKKIPAIRYADSVRITVPINPLTDKGENKIIVMIDDGNVVAEIDENNNSITKPIVIIEDEIRPISPYNYAIVNTAQPTFYASVANPFSGSKSYQIEVDTTELFNSSFKKSQTIASTGGLLEFKVPSLTLTDNRVYYWRTAPVPANGGDPIWNGSSFIYMANGSPGYNQSHYYQFIKNDYLDMSLAPDRMFNFSPSMATLRLQNAIFPIFARDRIRIYINDVPVGAYGCRPGSLQFILLDSINLNPVLNTVQSNGLGKFNSWPPCGYFGRMQFEFPYNDVTYRKRAMDFLDSVPRGMYVALVNMASLSNTSFATDWMADTALYGSGKSIYHSLISRGLTEIERFTSNVPFVFVFKSGHPDYPIYQNIGTRQDDYIDRTFDLQVKKDRGHVESPWFGPALRWDELKWDGLSLETPMDENRVTIYGKDFSGNESLLATITPGKDTSLSFIDAKAFPYLRLKLNTKDSLFVTPSQLQFWRLTGDLPPEGAIAPNLRLSAKDTLELGEKLNFELAFKNVSPRAFDSLKIAMVITDRNNVPHVLALPRKKPLAAGDTLLLSYQIDTKDFPEANTLFVNVNPDNDQPEQYLFNNFLFKQFYVRPDNYNPTLDVTFNGVRILNNDIVSSKPNILIKLKDNNRFMELNDTSLFNLKVRFPDNSERAYKFNTDTLRFTPANGTSADNTASLDFNPYFPEDGDYELIVNGKDRSGNLAGELEYRVAFKIINKPMISNLLNYPNPFTTSTAFVFTITGSEVPQEFKVQILTITGKVVREITREELGPIHIGRNITEFKWDGTDQYGQKLANGVYLYRFVTSLNGKQLEKYKQKGEQTDKFFNNGYGKMYLMR